MTPQPEIEPRPESHRSTGPATAEGKDRSRLNALRHGLSGQTVLMPWEDREAYQTHCAAILRSLVPVGEIETQCAQGVADDQWRLNRARAVDTNMFALGHFDYPAPETGNSQIDAALITARAFRDNSKAFVNLSLYEQRINRSLEKNFDRLEALQKERKAQEFLARRIKTAERIRAERSQAPGPHLIPASAQREPATPEPVMPERSGLIPAAPQSQTKQTKATGREFVYSIAAQSALDAALSIYRAHEPPAKVGLKAA